jgi:hypothetical protein
MPPARRTPQDRKPKAKPAEYTFEHEGKTYVIPPPSDALAQVDGRTFRDALMNGEAGELKLGFTCLELVCTDPETLDALYAKSVVDTCQIVGEWFQSADLSGASLPQS